MTWENLKIIRGDCVGQEDSLTRVNIKHQIKELRSKWYVPHADLMAIN